MRSNSNRSYSLRDLFHLKSSVKRHRLEPDPPHRRHKSQRQQQQKQPPAPTSRQVYAPSYSHPVYPAPQYVPPYYSTPSQYPAMQYCTTQYTPPTPRSLRYKPPFHRMISSSFSLSRPPAQSILLIPQRTNTHPNTSLTTDAHKSKNLNSLPPEIHLSIFDTLSPKSSTCLGLTNKKFYPLHRSSYQNATPTPLYQRSSDGGGVPLCRLLRDWVPEDYVLDWESGKLKGRETRYRNFSRKGAWVDKDSSQRGKERYCLHDDGNCKRDSRLKRKEGLGRHDIWYDGQRYR